MGTAPRPSADTIVRHRVTRPARSTMKPAMASTNSTLPSSDGWNWMTPRSSQRFEPRIVSAARNTTSMSARVAPYTTRQ